MRRRAIILSIMAAVVGLRAPAVRGDVVHLHNGRTLEGTVEEKGDTVRITTAAGVVTLKRSEIARIEKTKSPAEIYREKLAALPANDAEAAYQLALWCKREGLREECGQLIHRALAIDPRHAGAADEVRRALIHAPLPQEPKRLAALRKEFGQGFTVKQTGHYLVVYSCEEEFATGRIELLERLCKAFYGYFHDGQFPLAPVRKRLVVVIFGSPNEFRHYSKIELPQGVSAGGYYRTDTNRSIFFSTYSEDEYRRVRQSADRLRKVIASDAKAIPRMRRELSKARQRRDRQAVRRIQGALSAAENRKTQLARFETALSRTENSRVMVVLHEATHQLLFNTRLLRNPAGDPRWIHEGFAMLFESARKGKWRGLATPNVERLRNYRDYQKSGRLPAMRDVLVNQKIFYEVGRETLPYYASAWGLLYYLSHRRRADLNTYLRLVARHPPGPVADTARLNDFTEAFGPDLETLEVDWRAFMDRMKE